MLRCGFRKASNQFLGLSVFAGEGEPDDLFEDVLFGVSAGAENQPVVGA